MYTPLYLGTMYIYSKKILLTALPIFSMTTLCIPTVTGKSSNNRIVLAAITILYVSSVIEGVVDCLLIPPLIGTNGESMGENLLDEYQVFATTSGIPFRLLGFIPFIVADGLHVRHLFYVFDFF